jgi:putative mRNA 3-end processing factor
VGCGTLGWMRAPVVARPGPLGLDRDEAGLCLRAIDLRLDPIAAAPPGADRAEACASFVSHVHAGAAAASGRPFYASRETLALIGALGAALGPATAIDWDGAVERPIRLEYGGGTARLRLARAGHVLGAAQLVVDHPRGRLVYTGDWSPHGDATHPAGEVVACDELIVTCAFALPIFRFESPEAPTAALVEWCAQKLAGRATPVVLAASPGPAQAIVRALAERGLPVVAGAEVRRVCAAYEELGVPLGAVREPAAAGARARRGRGALVASSVPASDPSRDASSDPTHAVLIAPPGARASEISARGARPLAYASAWASLDAAVEQKRADAAFVIADQADFDALAGMVAASGARIVHATRGDAAAFAHLLRRLGHDADAIDLPAIDARGES